VIFALAQRLDRELEIERDRLLNDLRRAGNDVEEGLSLLTEGAVVPFDPHASPLCYDPAMETPENDEAESLRSSKQELRILGSSQWRSNTFV
jgi:hypothetical protein